ncbi:protein of unknown function [Nitrospira defluvii]|uniref:Uncharacterized protein n=1 Tax=Nitrospira defluvii TaxID=330214 RepID=D8PIB8_9BACT|nr:protein of unknown function [Nitrospira defluvii]
MATDCGNEVTCDKAMETAGQNGRESGQAWRRTIRRSCCVGGTTPRNRRRFRGEDLRRQLDEIKEERLLGSRGRNRMEMRILHHPMALDQRIDHIAAAQAPVRTQPHGVITFLQID